MNDYVIWSFKGSKVDPKFSLELLKIVSLGGQQIFKILTHIEIHIINRHYMIASSNDLQ